MSTEGHRAANRRYSQTPKGRASDRERQRRWRGRHPKVAAARIVALRAHGERVRAIARNRMANNDPTLPGPSVADTKRQEILRLSRLLDSAKDRGNDREADRLQRQYDALIGPAKRKPGLGLGITGLDLGTDSDPESVVVPFDPYA